VDLIFQYFCLLAFQAWAYFFSYKLFKE